MKHPQLSAIVILLQTFLLSTEATAGMFGFLTRYDVQLSPEVKGRVTLDGKPLSDVEIYRTLTYGEERLDRTRTDSDGAFRFPERNIKSRRPGRLFDETRVRQVVGLIYEDKNYLLWYTVPGGIKPSRSLSEKLGTLSCDLSSPEKEQVFDNYENPSFPHGVSSICRWDNS